MFCVKRYLYIGKEHSSKMQQIRNKKLLGAPGIATRTPGIDTRSKDATSSSWPYYYQRLHGVLPRNLSCTSRDSAVWRASISSV